jgi:hypothetical protein
VSVRVDSEGEAPRELSEEDTVRALALVFGRVEQLGDEMDHLPDPAVLSPLEGDDCATNPHKTSHAAALAIRAAVEHLDALRRLVQGAPVLHPTAPFTLARAAIETASAAVGMLAPRERHERVWRTLRYAVRDVLDQDKAMSGISTPSRTLLVRRARIDQLAATATGRPVQAVKPVTSTELVTAADDEPGASIFPVVTLWRLCSGFAHGRRWSTVFYLQQEEAQGPSGQPRLLMTNSYDRMIIAAWAALDVTEHALRLYTRGAAGPPVDSP